MVKTKATYRQLIGGLILLLLSSCGIKSYRTFGQDKKTNVFSDELIECDFSQVIYDNSSEANVYIDFKAKTDNKVEITNVSGQINWFQKGNQIPCSKTLTSTTVRLFQNDKSIADSTFWTNQFITDRLKTISGTGNSLLYVLEFRDTTFKFIPKTVDLMTVDLIINTKSQTTGKLDEHKKTIKLNANKHHYFWFLRDC